MSARRDAPRSKTRRSDALLRPEDLDGLGDLGMIARWVVEGSIIGLHRSRAHGISGEFAEYREYAPGDDLRLFDWKAFGRSDRSYIKKSHTETNTRVWLVVDASASMEYGDPAKLHYARCLAAAIAYIVAAQRDAVGLVTLADGVRDHLPAAGSPAHLQAIYSALGRLDPDSTTRMAPALHDLAEGIGRRGIVVLLSDLYDDDDEIDEAIRHFRFCGHEVVVFHLLDATELRFDFDKVRDFVDLETGERIEVHGPVFRDAYRERVIQWIESRRQAMNACRAEYVQLETSEPFARGLARYLHLRRAVRVAL